MSLQPPADRVVEPHAASMGAEQESQPEGNNFTQAEHAHSYSTPPELHLSSDRQSIDDDNGGIHRIRPIGFQRIT